MRTRRCDECSSTSTFSAAQCFLHERPQSSCHADACSVREPAMRHTVYGNICCAYVRALQRPRQNDVLKNGLYKMRLSPPRRQGNEARALQSTACMRSLARCRCAAITHHAAAERARKRDAARRCSSQQCSTGHVGASLTPWHAFRRSGRGNIHESRRKRRRGAAECARVWRERGLRRLRRGASLF